VPRSSEKETNMSTHKTPPAGLPLVQILEEGYANANAINTLPNGSAILSALRDLAEETAEEPPPGLLLENNIESLRGKRKSRLRYSKMHVQMFGREWRQITATPKHGWAITRVVKWIPLDGGADVIFQLEMTRRWPPKQKKD
jgi:hypothetical protein